MKQLTRAPRRIMGALSLVVGDCAFTGEAIRWSHAQIAVRNQGYVPFSEAPINYRSEHLSDPVAKLQQRLDSSKTKLVYEPGHGYLKSVLQELHIPVDSQTLVFSKTSFQYKKISPDHPRALYFNDDVYIGSVHEGKAIEVVSFDPMQGAIFYLLDEHQVEKPKFEQRRTGLRCNARIRCRYPPAGFQVCCCGPFTQPALGHKHPAASPSSLTRKAQLRIAGEDGM